MPRPQNRGRRDCRLGWQRTRRPSPSCGYRWTGQRALPAARRNVRRPSRSPSRRWSTVRARSCGEFLECRGDRLMIAERYNPVADDLAGFMTFAGDQEYVAGPQLGDGAADRFATIADFGGAVRG